MKLQSKTFKLMINLRFGNSVPCFLDILNNNNRKKHQETNKNKLEIQNLIKS